MQLGDFDINFRMLWLQREQVFQIIAIELRWTGASLGKESKLK
jgi:hypothetical protein